MSTSSRHIEFGRAVMLVGLLLLLTSCAAPATLAPVATQAPMATPLPATPTAVPTTAPTATLAPTAMPTLAPTATPTLAPTATLAATATPEPVATQANAGAAPLPAVDNDGLPVPADYTNLGNEQAPFRRTLTATSPTPLAAVLQFYRTELAGRQWAELPATTAPTAERAVLMFTSVSQGQLELQLNANADAGTDISLTIRDTAAAQAANALPPAGQARIYFASILDAPSTFKIAGQEIKVAPSNPSDSITNAPHIDVAPGKLAFTLTQAGAPAAEDAVQVAAGEIWILAAGPGGALAVQAY